MRLSLNTMLLNRITRMASDSDAYEHGPPGGKMAISSQPAFHHCLNAATTVLDSMASLAREQLTYASDTLLHFALYAATFLLQVSRANKSSEQVERTSRANKSKQVERTSLVHTH
jgi:hypothetical protein